MEHSNREKPNEESENGRKKHALWNLSTFLSKVIPFPVFSFPFLDISFNFHGFLIVFEVCSLNIYSFQTGHNQIQKKNTHCLIHKNLFGVQHPILHMFKFSEWQIVQKYLNRFKQPVQHALGKKVNFLKPS